MLPSMVQHRWLLAVALLVVFGVSVAAQDISRRITHVESYEPVPGDIYTVILDFGGDITGSNITRYDIPLQEDYSMEIPFLGSVSAGERTYEELRRFLIDSLRQVAPPSQYIDFVLKAPAVFDVFIYGAVASPGERSATSLTRLAEFIAATGGYGTGASNRRIALEREGRTVRYDFARYLIEGDADQNPYLRPNDRVYVPRMERTVTIEGAVARPSTYELLPDESMEDLFELAGGLLPVSEVEDITWLRLSESGGYSLLRLAGRAPDEVVLEPGDIVTVPSLTRSTERITIEGALFGQKAETGEPQEIPSTPVRFTLPYQPGVTLLTVLESLGGPTPFARSEDSFVIRGNSRQRIPLPDLSEIWERKAWERDLPLEPGDYIVIPMVSPEVSIGGAVNSPTSVPYAAGLTVADYIRLAGGINRTSGSEDRIYLIDEEGRRIRAGMTQVVEPGQVVFVEENRWTVTERFLTRTLVITSFVTAVIELTQLIIGFAGSF